MDLPQIEKRTRSYGSQISNTHLSIEDLRWDAAAPYVSDEIKQQTDLAIDGPADEIAEARKSHNEEASQGDGVHSCTSDSTKHDNEQDANDHGEKAEDENGGPGKPTKPIISMFKGKEVIWVEWENNDPHNPLNWPKSRKWVATALTVIFTLLASTGGSIYSLGIKEMQEEFHNSKFLSNVGVSMYPLGFGLPPLVLAPFSEVYGRNAVYIPSMFLFVIFFLPVALAPNIGSVIAGRFLCGAAASTGSTMVGGSLADIWEAHERGIPMAMFSLAAFTGMGFGPVYSGWTAQTIGWRWIEWITMIMVGVVFVFFLLFLKESRASVLLSRRAAKLRKSTGDERYQCRADYERASLSIMIKTSLSRPLLYLFTEPVVTVFSTWIAFVWGLMWALLPAMSLVFRNVYNFSTGALGTSYLALLIGPCIAACFLPYQERIYAKRAHKDGPEARLYSSLVGGLLVPIGIFIFGWSQGRGHWIGPLIGIGIMMCGCYTIYLAIFSYLADTYTLYASSAIAAQSLARNLFGFAFPLFTDAMYNNLGYSWAPTLVAIIALILAMCPFILLFYGPKLRSRSRALIALEEDIQRRKQERLELEQEAAGTKPEQV